jgi:hypothetical protein
MHTAPLIRAFSTSFVGASRPKSFARRSMMATTARTAFSSPDLAIVGTRTNVAEARKLSL